jgi:hypothetical protein
MREAPRTSAPTEGLAGLVDRVACTDCGFDTSAGMGRVTEDVV